MATTMRFLILGDDVSGSRAFDKFNRSVDRTNRTVERNNKILDDQNSHMKVMASGVVSATSTFTGFGDATAIASRKTSIFVKGLAALNLATSLLEPTVAGLVVVTGALTSAMVSGGVGLAAFAAAAGPAIKQTGELLKAQQQAAQGVQQSQAYIDALKEAPPAVRAFAGELKLAGAAYNSWARELATPVLQPFRSALTLVNPLLHDLAPFAKAAAGALNQLVAEMRAAVTSSGFQDWLAQILPNVRPVIENLGRIIGNLVKGIGGIAAAFAPVVRQILGGITSLTEKFADWGATLTGHTGFQALMAMFREQTPLVVQVLKNLGEVIVNITSAMAGLASPGNSKALLQILMPISSIMRVLSENEALLRTVMYFGLLYATLKRLYPVALGVQGVLGAMAGRELAGGLGRTVQLVQQFAAGFKSVTAAGLPITGVAGTLGGKFRKALDSVAGSSVPAAKGIERVGSGIRFIKTGFVALAPTVGVIGGMAAGFVALANIMGRNLPTVDEYVQALRDQFRLSGWNVAGYERFAATLKRVTSFQVVNAGITEKVNGQLRIQSDEAGRVQRNYNAYTVATEQLNARQAEAEAQAKRINSGLAELQRQYGLTRPQAIQLATAAGTTADQFARGGRETQRAKDRIADYVAQAKLTHDPAQQVADDLDAISNKALSANDRLSALNSTLQALVGNYNDLIGTHLAAAQALADLAKKAQETGNKTGFATQKQRDLTGQLQQTTKSALDFSSATFKQTGNVAKSIGPLVKEVEQIRQLHLKGKPARDTTNKLIDAIIKLGTKGGWSEGKIADLISRILKIPKKSAWELLMKGTGRWTVKNARWRFFHTGANPTGFGITRAGGGEVRGPGGPVGDKIPASLSDREWVIRSSSARKYGNAAMSAVNRGTARIGYAEGGQARLTGNKDVLSGKLAEERHHELYATLRDEMRRRMWAEMMRQMRAAVMGPRIPYFDQQFNNPRVLRDILIPYFGRPGWGSYDNPQQTWVNFAGHRVQVNKTIAQMVRNIGQRVARAAPGYVRTIGGYRRGPDSDITGYGGHHFGIALDINAGENMPNSPSYTMPRAVINQFHPGWVWGGTWSGYRDYMHFGFQGGTGGPSAPLRGSYSVAGMARLWRLVGGPARLAHLMGAIGMAESSGNPRIRNSIGASGLWQILMPQNAWAVRGNVFNPLVNAAAALRIYRVQGLRAWEAYTNGMYRQFMGGGGAIREPVAGVGLKSGAGYMLGESGTEYVSSQADLKDVAQLLRAVLGELRRQTPHIASGPERTGGATAAALTGTSRRVLGG